MWSMVLRPLKSGRCYWSVTAAHHAALAASTTSAQLGRIFGGHGRLWASRPARWLSCVPGRSEGANRFGNTWANPLRFTSGSAASSSEWETVHDNIMVEETTKTLGWAAHGCEAPFERPPRQTGKRVSPCPEVHRRRLDKYLVARYVRERAVQVVLRHVTVQAEMLFCSWWYAAACRSGRRRHGAAGRVVCCASRSATWPVVVRGGQV